MPRSAVARSVSRGLHAVAAGHVVHAGEPLRRRAIDDRRLVPPAVHVAVRELLGVQQRADVAQLVDDLRIRLPDLQAAEERQARRRSGRRPAPDSASRRPSCRSGGTTGSRRCRTRATSGRCRCPAPASRSRRGRRATRGRRTDGGSAMRSSAAPGAVATTLALELVAREARLDQVLREHEVPARRRHQRVGEVRDARSAPGWRESSTASSSRSPRAPGRRAAAASPNAAASFARSRVVEREADVDRDVDCGPRTRLRPRRARCWQSKHQLTGFRPR